jgi:hypothetical protein
VAAFTAAAAAACVSKPPTQRVPRSLAAATAHARGRTPQKTAMFLKRVGGTGAGTTAAMAPAGGGGAGVQSKIEFV